MSKNAHNQMEQQFPILHAGYARHRKPLSLVIPSLKHYIIRIQLEGSAHIRTHDQYVPILPGQMIMLGPKQHYDLKIGYKDPETMETMTKVHSLDYYMMVNGPWIEKWWLDHQPPWLSNHAIDDRMLAIWREIMQEQRLPENHMNDIVRHLTFVLFLMFERALQHPHMNSLDDRTTQLAHRMKQYIEINATESFSIQDVAESVQVSASRASHLFKDVFQQSIMDYAIEVRISMACERILHGYMSLEQIAEMCGFQSYSYFHRTFRNRLGLSPKQFREQRQFQDGQ
ncbi:AraC family transcriptional regulator [Paenibacillus sp. ACRRX]|uniref:helix-turn-helix transcriptional regulator n=1 Tax=unclassified Paenibacillus TaxID=185978 RepID=UPI001EF71300|nr:MULTISPECIES: AraC family transcriptional regulator [unclassified Paenibacillus]MCG7410114.1 AraC family transcriptional regulator [Paenibacillus sp. ACRRX]MDK8183688.1 AraC family transcriptional regulator [Paenibacillus sp. UMB4589-SE434]